MKITKKLIESEIKRQYGVDIDFHKCGGFFYYGGTASCLLDETCTYIKYLSDIPSLEWLMNDFQTKVNNYLEWSDYDSIKEAVEKTDWSLDNPAEPIILRIKPYKRKRDKHEIQN